MPHPQSKILKLKLVQRGRGIYYIEWWNSEKKYPERISCGATDRKKAEDALVLFRAGLLTPPKPSTPRVDIILDGYLADREAIGADVKWAVVALRRHLGALTVTALSSQVVADYYDKRRREGRRAKGGGRQTLADGTLVREGVTLRAAIRWAISEKWLAASDEPKIRVPPTPPPRDRWLSRDEFDKLLAAAEADHIKLFILLALATTGRRGAIIELTWDRVDLVTGLVNLGRGRGSIAPQ